MLPRIGAPPRAAEAPPRGVAKNKPRGVVIEFRPQLDRRGVRALQEDNWRGVAAAAVRAPPPRPTSRGVIANAPHRGVIAIA